MNDLRPGAIVHTYIAAINPPKHKYGLIAHIDPARDAATLFLIHSELPRLIQNDPTLAKGIARVLQAEHQFLEYDSWMRFGEPYTCQYSDLAAQVQRGERCICGFVSESLLRRLLALIPDCDDLPPKKQRLYCDSLATDPRLRAP